jgi:hypothetical protein
MVTTGTRRGLLVVFAPAEFDIARLERVVGITAARMHEFTGSVEVEQLIT